MNPPSTSGSDTPKPAILHICSRETLRPLRDQIMRLSGYEVDSTLSHTEALAIFARRPYHLVLIDVEGESGIYPAETLCADMRTTHPGQLIAFVCNWRVANLTDCPDEILRAEFDPRAFAEGVQSILANQSPPAP
jgi:DNA-binding response OmpR family regulator